MFLSKRVCWHQNLVKFVKQHSKFFDVELYTTENEKIRKFPVYKAVLQAKCAYLSTYISEALMCKDV